MSIETEPLKLLVRSVEEAPGGALYALRFNGEKTSIHPHYEGLFRRVASGVTLAQIAREYLGGSPSPQSRVVPDGRMISLARFLVYLADQELLAEQRAIRLAEALRSEYSWRESFAFVDLVSLPLLKLTRRQRDGFNELLLLIVILFCSIGSILLFLKMMVDGHEGWSGLSVAQILIAFFFTFSMGRSVKALLLASVEWLSLGRSTQLSFYLDSVSMGLKSEDVSRATMGRRGIFLALLAMLAVLSPLLAVGILPALRPFQAAVLLFAGQMFLVEFSPFAKSSLTDILRLFFNRWEQVKASSPLSGGALEVRVQRLHQSSIVVWVFMTCGLFWGGYSQLLIHLRESVVSGSALEKVTALLLVFLQVIIWCSIAMDAWNALVITGAKSKFQVRRFWLKKRAAMSMVEEKVVDGQGMSRADLEKLPFLRQLDFSVRNQLLSRSQLVSVKEGKAVCRQGERGRDLFIVISGKLAVAKRVGSSRRRVVALLDKGSVFGEAAFFFGHSRTADVVAMEPSVVMRIQHDESMKTLGQEKSEELQLRIWFLQALVSNSFLRDVPSEALDALLMVGRKHSFRAGTKVISEGECADACYFLIQGKASVVQNTVPINKLKSGDVFGEIALIRANTLRSATVIAESDLLTVRLEAEVFWALMATHLPLAVEIERLAERRLAQDRLRQEG